MAAPGWFLKINDAIMPTPDEATFDEYDLDSANTGRPESGVLNRDRKRTNLGRYPFKWKNLTAAQAWQLRAALAPEEVTVTIWMFDRPFSRTMYAGDRHWEQWIDNNTGEAHIGLTVQFSEV